MDGSNIGLKPWWLFVLSGLCCAAYFLSHTWHHVCTLHVHLHHTYNIIFPKPNQDVLLSEMFLSCSFFEIIWILHFSALSHA